MLFLMAMEPLHMLFRKAQEVGLLSKLSPDCDIFRVSLYADGTVVFITPSKQDLQVTYYILQLFAQTSGLRTNSLKTCYYPIQCDAAALNLLASSGRVLSSFPCTYLGLPLDAKKPTRDSLQPLVQKIAHRLPGWKKCLLTYPERELLVKSALSAILTHFLTIFKLPKWTILGVDRYRRSFMWRGTDLENIRGGHCLVNWDTCLRPKKLGGLGISDLENFNRALRLKWLWQSWVPRERQWKNLLNMHDATDRALFFSSTIIHIGDAKFTPFWGAKWVHETAPKDLAPDLYKSARFKKRLVFKKLQRDNWIRSIGEISCPTLLDEFVLLYMALSSISLSQDHDKIV
jgi:hypothetical protein